MALKQGDYALLEHGGQGASDVEHPGASGVRGDRRYPARPAHLVSLGRRAVGDGDPARRAAKLKALTQNPKVALTIDDNTFPHKMLLICGTADVGTVAGVVPEWAHRLGNDISGRKKGKAWGEHIRTKGGQQARIAVIPE